LTLPKRKQQEGISSAAATTTNNMSFTVKRASLFCVRRLRAAYINQPEAAFEKCFDAKRESEKHL